MWIRIGQLDERGEIVMGGRFGKYGDLKRKAALRKSRKEKGRLQKDPIPKSPKRRKAEKDFPKKQTPEHRGSYLEL